MRAAPLVSVHVALSWSRRLDVLPALAAEALLALALAFDFAKDATATTGRLEGGEGAHAAALVLVLVLALALLTVLTAHAALLLLAPDKVVRLHRAARLGPDLLRRDPDVLRAANEDDLVVVCLPQRGTYNRASLATCRWTSRERRDELVFEYERVRHVIDVDAGTARVVTYPAALEAAAHVQERGLASAERARRLVLYGPNRVFCVLPSLTALVWDHAWSPFTLQLTGIVAVLASAEYLGAAALAAFYVVGMNWAEVANRRATAKFVSVTALVPTTAEVLVNGAWKSNVPVESLVPGDVVRLPRLARTHHDNAVVPCDLVLVSGECQVLEDEVTHDGGGGGEDAVVEEARSKRPVDPSVARGPPARASDARRVAAVEARHVLLMGTRVVRTSGPADVVGVVIRTGFATEMGKLYRSVLSPTGGPNWASSDSDVLAVLVTALVAGMVWSRGVG